MRRIGYQNAVLTVIAGVLTLGLVERAGQPSIAAPSAANAQPSGPEQGGLMNAMEQRKTMIAELRAMNARLDRIESKLAGGLTVKVSEMPPIKLPPETRASGETKERKPETLVEVKPADFDAGK